MIGRANSVAAIALALGIAAGSALCWVSFQSPPQPTCGSPGGGDGGLGTGPTLGTPKEQTVGLDHWYNFSVQAMGGGLLLSDLGFHLVSQGGTNVTPGSGWSLIAYDSSGGLLGNYSLYGPGAGAWTSGGTTAAAAGQLYSLLTTPGNVSGDGFVMSIQGVGSCPTPWIVNTSIP
jgi:hypothetical protein